MLIWRKNTAMFAARNFLENIKWTTPIEIKIESVLAIDYYKLYFCGLNKNIHVHIHTAKAVPYSRLLSIHIPQGEKP